MLTKEITSLQHPIVKHFVKLRTKKKFRYEMRQIVVMGKKMIEEIGAVDQLLCLKGSRIRCKAKETYFISDAVLKKVTGVESPEAFVALIPMPALTPLTNKKFILALNNIADPGNLGTLIRTALALGWEGVFLTQSSVDPFNDKALRAAKGATFRLPLYLGSEEELKELLQKEKLTPLIADASGTPIGEVATLSSCCLIMGNESHGPSDALTFEKISIPIQSMESLNVAQAGAILLYELKGRS